MSFAKTFKDANGREWTVNLSLADARRMKDIAGVSLDDLVPIIDGKKKDTAEQIQPLQRFLSDPFRVFDAFWALVKPQADNAGVTKEQLETGITFYTDADGKEIDVAELMAMAILQAIIDFFRRDPTRTAILGRVQELMALIGKRIEREMKKLDLPKMIDALPGIDADKLNELALAQSTPSVADTRDTSAYAPSTSIYGP